MVEQLLLRSQSPEKEETVVVEVDTVAEVVVVAADMVAAATVVAVATTDTSKEDNKPLND